MLETFVSSRIRRALFEHILTHPRERFYLRGLAKQLQVSVSPLRRELKRLEEIGMLAAAEEGSMRFYTVNTASPVFLQLQSAGSPVAAPSPAAPSQTTRPGTEPQSGPWRRPLAAPVLVGIAGAGLALMLVVAGLVYVRMTGSASHMTVLVPSEPGSGVMRGRRWQVVPGGFGGFSTASTTESF